MSRAKKPVRLEARFGDGLQATMLLPCGHEVEVYENMSVVHVCNGYSHCVSYQKKRLKLKKKGGS